MVIRAVTARTPAERSAASRQTGADAEPTPNGAQEGNTGMTALLEIARLEEAAAAGAR